MVKYNEYQTRKRTRRRRRTFTTLILLFCILAGTGVAGRIGHGSSPNRWDPVPEATPRATPFYVDVTAANACLMSCDGVLFKKGSDEKITPASTAKMLTALTVLDYYLPDDSITVGDEIALMVSDASRAWLNVGDELTVRQLLVALLLPSGNDAAFTLAVNTGRIIAKDDSLSNEKSVEAFMKSANKKAKALGATKSKFKTPDGYDADGQYTTAYDLALIAMACLDNSCIAEIVGNFTISDTWLSGREVTYQNTNKLLNPDSEYYYPAAIGLKTGSSSLSGYCLVSAAVIDDETYVCVVMGADIDGRFSESIKIYNKLEA